MGSNKHHVHNDANIFIQAIISVYVCLVYIKSMWYMVFSFLLHPFFFLLCFFFLFFYLWTWTYFTDFCSPKFVFFHGFMDLNQNGPLFCCSINIRVIPMWFWLNLWMKTKNWILHQTNKIVFQIYWNRYVYRLMGDKST